MIYQLIYLALTFIGFGVSACKHGEDKEGKHKEFIRRYIFRHKLEIDHLRNKHINKLAMHAHENGCFYIGLETLEKQENEKTN